MIAIFQAILMAFVFVQANRKVRTSNLILAATILVFAILTTGTLLLSIRTIFFDPVSQKAIFIASNSALLVGPLLYLYVRSLLENGFTTRVRDTLHAIPFLIAEVCSAVIVNKYQSFIAWSYPGRIYFSGAIVLQNFAYLVAALRILHANGLPAKSFLSFIDNSKLAWVRFFTIGYIVLWSIQLQLFVGWDVLNRPQWCPYTSSLYFLTTFLFFNGMVYLGLKKPDMFYQGQKYQYSSLRKSDIDEYQQKLISIMKDNKLYLDPSLTLIDVARKIGLAPSHVSQIINESFNQNFRDFINKYRIEESKLLLTRRNQNLNILGIAHDAGFNSKSSFNSAFKKHTGTTPKEYRKEVLFSHSS